MVELIAARDGDKLFVDYLPELQADTTTGWRARRNSSLVRLTGMRFDFRMAPCSIAIGMIALPLATNPIARSIETAHRSARPAAEVYEDLRAGGESGWDFTSRWLADSKNLSTIRTTSIAPVDLNTLMMHLEENLRQGLSVEEEIWKRPNAIVR